MGSPSLKNLYALMGTRVRRRLCNGGCGKFCTYVIGCCVNAGGSSPGGGTYTSVELLLLLCAVISSMASSNNSAVCFEQFCSKSCRFVIFWPRDVSAFKRFPPDSSMDDIPTQDTIPIYFPNFQPNPTSSSQPQLYNNGQPLTPQLRNNNDSKTQNSINSTNSTQPNSLRAKQYLQKILTLTKHNKVLQQKSWTMNLTTIQSEKIIQMPQQL